MTEVLDTTLQNFNENSVNVDNILSVENRKLNQSNTVDLDARRKLEDYLENRKLQKMLLDEYD